MMIGDPGVGKTAIVEGLAKRIVEKSVPEVLEDKVIWSLDIASLVAGTKYRGDFEERMKQIIKALQSDKNAIAFIDEIHMIMGAGSGGGGNGSIDAANMLKPALSRGEIRCIGSTTQEEYRRNFEKDRALVRRFQKIDVNEPSVEDTKRILRGIARYYEEYHGTKYLESALDAAVDLTVKHVHDKCLPDKAIDVIDSAAAWQRIRPPASRVSSITKKEIEAEVSRMAKIPVESIKSTEVDRLRDLEGDLKMVVFGQDDALDNLVNSVYMSRSGLRENDKTLGAYLFTGPSGVGKTEAAKQLALSLDIDFIRFDMSEYQERHSVSKFIGSPPGYVGYGDGSAGSGLLINALEKSPHCVLLFDEIEKAHQDVYNIFLQMMDRGMVTSSNGKSVSARNAVVIFTSNLGAAEMEKELIGFTSRSESRDEDTKAVNTFFTPEFRNRLDGIIRFNRLSKENMGRIVDKFIGQLNDLSSRKSVNIVVDQAAKDWLIEKGFDKNMGARPLARVIAENIKKPLAREMLFGRLRNGGAVTVRIKDDKLDFEYMDTAVDAEDVSVDVRDGLRMDGVDA
jgi:ATP-dependent Clp protease ATP-binding subunit ClpA